MRDLYGGLNKTSIEEHDYKELEENKYTYIKGLNEHFYESFRNLNKHQKSAVVSDTKALLLNAGVGSGKTTVLVHKVLYLHHIKGVPLDKMVVLTFTNKAADEIKDRVLSSGQGVDRKGMCYFGTFHSVARNLLSSILPVEDLGYTKDFSIMDEVSSQELFESIISLNNLGIKYKNKLEKRLDEYKNGRLLHGNMKYNDEIEKFVILLEQEKKKRNLMDFDDLILNCGRLLRKGDFKPDWVIIDEFQDTDSEQFEMMDGLIWENSRVFAVGDPNQLIYSWRGSRQGIFDMFMERYDAALETLPINYRSTDTILKAAREFLSHPGQLEGIRDTGAPIIVKRHFNSFNEALYLADTIKKLHAGGVPYKEIAIFYRKQKHSSVFEDVFKRENIPYEVSIRKNIKDIPVLYWILRLLKASLNDHDTDNFVNVLIDKRYGIGLTQKQALDIIKGKGEQYGIPELMGKIREFCGWCRSLADSEGLAEKIFGYYDLKSYLSPTSITYDEDRDLTMKFLLDLEGYIKANGYSPFEGIKNAVEYTILYGSQIIDQIINPENDSIKLMTLHASKGLEFKYVFISGANMGVIPLGGRFDDEEEKRLFFVGITRAKDFLEISYHSNPDDFNALPNPSPYIRMIPDELIEGEEIKSRAHLLSELRKEIKSNMDRKQDASDTPAVERRKVRHSKYGEGYIVSETEEMYTVQFDTYGEKSFAKLFCPLEFHD